MVHTNEVQVFLGQDTYIDATTRQAKEILKRRQEVAGVQIEDVRSELTSLQARLGVLEPEFNEDGVRISDFVFQIQYSISSTI